MAAFLECLKKRVNRRMPKMATSALKCDLYIFCLSSRAMVRSMTIDKRQGAVFASGVLLGAAAVAGAWKKRVPVAPQAPEAPEASAPLPPSAPENLKTSAQPPRFSLEVPKENVLPPQPVACDRASSSTNARVPPRQPWPEPPTATFPPLQPAAPTSRQLKVFISGSILAAAAIAGTTITLNASLASS